MSLAQTVSALSSVLGRPVTFIPDCQGEEAKAAIARLGNGDIALLENTRFHAGEEKNDPVLIEAMAALGDLYVNDAFSAAHRAHVSTEGLAYRSEEHTSELQSLMRISYSVFCLKKKTT